MFKGTPGNGPFTQGKPRQAKASQGRVHRVDLAIIVNYSSSSINSINSMDSINSINSINIVSIVSNRR